MQDFYCPLLEPFVSKEGKIEYVNRKKYPCYSYPAYSYRSWKEFGKNYLPARNSSLGSLLKFAAFCGEYIKQMVNSSNWTVEDAWNEVCSKGASGDYPFKKILAEDSKWFWTAGGFHVNFFRYEGEGDYEKYIFNDYEDDAVLGWIVFQT